MYRKGIIMAGGSGNRLFPLTKTISKHLLNVFDKPMIYYPLSTLMLAGIKEILIITNNENLIFFKKLLGNGNQLGLSIKYEIEESPDGIANGLIIGEKFLEESHCTLILGDNLFYGNNLRDYTYIDDIVEGVIKVVDKVATFDPEWSSDDPNPSSSNAPWRGYNIGNNKPVKLMNYIQAIEKALGKQANKELFPIQPGDVPNTWADVNELIKQFDYQPNTTVDQGVKKFVNWFREYYKI